MTQKRKSKKPSLAAQLRHYRETVAVLQSANDRIRSQYSESVRQFQQARERNLTLAIELAQARQQLEGRTVTMEERGRQLAAFQERITSLESETASQADQRADLESQLEESQDFQRRTEASLDEAKRQLDHLWEYCQSRIA